MSREAFDAKRATVFEHRGVRVDNIMTIDVQFAGYAVDGKTCALCGHGIKWLYTLVLGIRGAGQEVFEPVGSTCIETWAESLPVSDAQRAILAKLKLLVGEVNEIKGHLRQVSAEELNGQLSAEEAESLRVYLMSPSEIRHDLTLLDISGRVWRLGRFASDKQAAFFAGRLKSLQRAEGAPACAKCGGKTLYRDGRYGAFYGCAAYPQCRWTINASKVGEQVPAPTTAPPAHVNKQYALFPEKLYDTVATSPSTPPSTIGTTGWDDPAEVVDEDADYAF